MSSQLQKEHAFPVDRERGGGISQNFERGTKVEEERSVAPLQPRLETMQIKNELELEKQQYG